MRTYLSFETAVADIDARLDELRAVAEKGDSPSLADEIARLEARAEKALADLYATLTPWQKTMVARAQGRPRFGDYVKALIDEFTPLAGDRYFGEDEAIVGGLGRFEAESVCILGQEKGDDTDGRVRHNFGMARPEGYRKAVRLMGLADRFDLPVISLVDTAGAFPGVEAEERGQAEAIARSTDACLSLGVPNVAVIIGEGGSGGAVAIATGNSVLMLEHAIYTVVSPEASASILWRDSSRAQDAATSMKITAQDLLKFGIIDRVYSRAGRRGPSRSAGCDRGDRQGDRRRAEIAAQYDPRRPAGGAGRKIPRDRAKGLGALRPATPNSLRLSVVSQ